MCFFIQGQNSWSGHFSPTLRNTNIIRLHTSQYAVIKPCTICLINLSPPAIDLDSEQTHGYKVNEWEKLNVIMRDELLDNRYLVTFYVFVCVSRVIDLVERLHEAGDTSQIILITSVTKVGPMLSVLTFCSLRVQQSGDIISITITCVIKRALQTWNRPGHRIDEATSKS